MTYSFPFSAKKPYLVLKLFKVVLPHSVDIARSSLPKNKNLQNHYFCAKFYWLILTSLSPLSWVYQMKKMAKELTRELVDGESYEYVPLGKHVVAAPGICGGRPTFNYTRTSESTKFHVCCAECCNSQNSKRKLRAWERFCRSGIFISIIMLSARSNSSRSTGLGCEQYVNIL